METLNQALLTFLLNSVWQVALMAAAAWIASLILRNNPASHRHAVWTIALIASLALPLASIPSPGANLGTSHLVCDGLSEPVVPAGREDRRHTGPIGRPDGQRR